MIDPKFYDRGAFDEWFETLAEDEVFDGSDRRYCIIAVWGQQFEPGLRAWMDRADIVHDNIRLEELNLVPWQQLISTLATEWSDRREWGHHTISKSEARRIIDAADLAADIEMDPEIVIEYYDVLFKSAALEEVN